MIVWNAKDQDSKEADNVSRRGLMAKVAGLMSGFALFNSGCEPSGQQTKNTSPRPENVRPEFRKALIERITNYRYAGTDYDAGDRYAQRYTIGDGEQNAIWKSATNTNGAQQAARDHHDWLFYGNADGMDSGTPPFFHPDNGNFGFVDAMGSDVTADAANDIASHPGITPNSDEIGFLNMIFEGARGLDILVEFKNGERPRFSRVWEDVYHVLQYKVNNSAADLAFIYGERILDDIESSLNASALEGEALETALEIVAAKKDQILNDTEYREEQIETMNECY